MSAPRRVAKAAPKHAPRTPFLLLLAGLFGGGMVLLLVLNTASAANEVARHDLATQDAGVAASVQDLRNQVAASAAPGNLMDAANQLGMVPAGNPAFLVIGPDGRITVMGRPGAATEPPLPVVKKPKPKPTKSPATTAAKSSANPSPSSTGKKSPSAGRSKTPTASKTPTTPSATPTPTVTIPGGAR